MTPTCVKCQHEMRPGFQGERSVWFCSHCSHQVACLVVPPMLKEPATPRQEALTRRKVAMGKTMPGGMRGKLNVSAPPGPGSPFGITMRADVPGKARPTYQRMAEVSCQRVGHFHNPALSVARAISDALDPVKAPGKVRTLADMTPEERETLLKKYAR